MIRLHTKLGWEENFIATEVDSERSRYVCGVYLQDVLTEFALQLQVRQESIDVFTGWGNFDRCKFPANCIVIHRGDEQALPQRVHADRALLLKEYGVTLKPLTLHNGVCSAGFAEVAYDIYRDVKASLRNRKAHPTWLAIPIGYSNAVEPNAGPFVARPIDVSFAGSISHNEHRSLKERILYPKRIARRKMLSALERLQNDTNFIVANHITRHYADVAESGMTYASLLKNTKVAVAPRGTSRETFRHFEAAMAGCVVVTEPLPDHWFYRSAPFVYLRDWTTLSKVLSELFSNIDALRKRSNETSIWWKATCSPSVLADYILNHWRTAAQGGIRE